MIFPTRINGIPCQCKIIAYSPEQAMAITGFGFGDAEPPEPGTFEFQILDRKGYRALWLEAYLTPWVEAELYQQFLDRLANYQFQMDEDVA